MKYPEGLPNPDIKLSKKRVSNSESAKLFSLCSHSKLGVSVAKIFPFLAYQSFGTLGTEGLQCGKTSNWTSAEPQRHRGQFLSTPKKDETFGD